MKAKKRIYNWMISLHMIMSRIHTKSDVVTTFGKVSQEKNKYQGGTLAADGYIYAIPSNSNNILCIDSNDKDGDEDNTDIYFNEEDAAYVIGDIVSTKRKRTDKFQGKTISRIVIFRFIYRLG